jgi:hypothetical protein
LIDYCWPPSSQTELVGYLMAIKISGAAKKYRRQPGAECSTISASRSFATKKRCYSKANLTQSAAPAAAASAMTGRPPNNIGGETESSKSERHHRWQEGMNFSPGRQIIFPSA